MKTCNKCKNTFPDAQFPFSLTGDKTRRIGFCIDCNVKVKAYNKKYREDPKSALVLASCKKRWRDSDHGKAVTHTYVRSDMNKEAQAKYWATDNGKEAARRRLEKHRHSIDLQIGFSQLLSGSRKVSGVVFRCTEFKSAEEVKAHVYSTLQPNMRPEDYGSTWEVDHKIPRSEYDHDDPEDVYRCWSRANIRASWITDNRSKNCSVVPNVVATVPHGMRPKRWAN